MKLIVHEKQIESGWTHVNIIAYKVKSQKKDILPGKVALIGNTIYLSDVYAPFKDIMKI